MDLSTYYTTICKEPILSKDEEFELFSILKSPDSSEPEKTKAQDRIIRANLRFVFKTAKNYSKNDPNVFEELISAGNEGLLVGLEKYNPSRKVRFLSYAGWWVIQRILKEMSKMRIVSLPIWKQQLSARITKARENSETDLSLEELSKEFPDIPKKDLHELYDTRYLTYYLEDITGDPELSIDPISDEVERDLDDSKIRRLVRSLDSPYREVLELTYGFNDGTPRSDTYIAKTLKLSRDNVKELKEDALNKIREELN